MSTSQTTADDTDYLDVELHNGTKERLTKIELLTRIWGPACEILAKRQNVDPLCAIEAVYMHIHLEKPLPPALKEWFLNGLEKHKELGGDQTLDKIYGLSGEERKRRAYTTAQNKSGYHIRLMHDLLKLVEGLKPTEAARLVIWREGSTLDPKDLQKRWRKFDLERKDQAIHSHNFFDEKEAALDFLNSFISNPKIAYNNISKDLKKLLATYVKIAQ